MKFMQMVAAVTVTAALALGSAGCEKKEEAKKPAAAAGDAGKGLMKDVAPKAAAPAPAAAPAK